MNDGKKCWPGDLILSKPLPHDSFKVLVKALWTGDPLGEIRTALKSNVSEGGEGDLWSWGIPPLFYAFWVPRFRPWVLIHRALEQSHLQPKSITGAVLWLNKVLYSAMLTSLEEKKNQTQILNTAGWEHWVNGRTGPSSPCTLVFHLDNVNNNHTPHTPRI